MTAGSALVILLALAALGRPGGVHRAARYEARPDRHLLLAAQWRCRRAALAEVREVPAQHGWQPVVLHPGEPELVAEDPDLLDDVPPEAEAIEAEISEPYRTVQAAYRQVRRRRCTPSSAKEKRKAGAIARRCGCAATSSSPMPVWAGWVASVRFLKQYLREHPVDVMVTTGPPHSMHLIGLRLKRALGIRWVADFRDPWTNIDFTGS